MVHRTLTPEGERLAAYASGSCAKGLAASRERVALGRSLVARRPPPAPAPAAAAAMPEPARSAP